MSTRKRKYVCNPSVLLQNPDYLNIPQALEWIGKHYNMRICEKTLYNWIAVGRIGSHRRRRKLPRYRLCGQLTLKKEWLINFITEMSR